MQNPHKIVSGLMLKKRKGYDINKGKSKKRNNATEQVRQKSRLSRTSVDELEAPELDISELEDRFENEEEISRSTQEDLNDIETPANLVEPSALHEAPAVRRLRAIGGSSSIPDIVPVTQLEDTFPSQLPPNCTAQPVSLFQTPTQ